jgi:hypothetical protein
MKLIISESQLKYIIKEQSFGYGPGGSLTISQAKVHNDAISKLINVDPHVILGIMEFGASFIPEYGPAIVTLLSIGDAAIYYHQGRKREAGIALVLGAIPMAGQLINEIPGAKQLGAKGLSILADKIAKGITKITPVENQVLNFINLNKPLIHKELDGLFTRVVKNVANNTTKKSLKPVINYAAKGADAGVNYIKNNVVNDLTKKGYNTAYNALN